MRLSGSVLSFYAMGIKRKLIMYPKHLAFKQIHIIAFVHEVYVGVTSLMKVFCTSSKYILRSEFC